MGNRDPLRCHYVKYAYGVVPEGKARLSVQYVRGLVHEMLQWTWPNMDLCHCSCECYQHYSWCTPWCTHAAL